MFRSLTSVVVLLIVLVSVHSKALKPGAAQNAETNSLERRLIARDTQPVTITAAVQAVVALAAEVNATVAVIVSTTTSITAALEANVVANIATKISAKVQALIDVTSRSKADLQAAEAQIIASVNALIALDAELQAILLLQAQLSAALLTLNTAILALPSTQVALTGQITAAVTAQINAVVQIAVQLQTEIDDLGVQIDAAVADVVVDLNALLSLTAQIGLSATGKTQATVQTAVIKVEATVSAALNVVAKVDTTVNAQIAVLDAQANGIVADANVALNILLNLVLNACICLSTVTGG